MSTQKQTNWSAALQADLTRLQQGIDKHIAAQAAKSLRQGTKSEAVIVNRQLRQIDTLEKRLRKTERVLAKVALALEECAIPSPFVKDARQQISDALRLNEDLRK